VKLLTHGAQPAPDFLRPVSRPGVLAWGLLTVGGVLLLLGATDGWQAHRLREDALALVAKNSARAALRAPAKTTTSANQKLASRGASAQALEATRLRRLLAHPWAPTWAATEAAAVQGVVWLSMDHDTTGPLRLQGTAVDAASAQRATRALRDAGLNNDAPLWSEVLLTRMEREGKGQRIEITALPKPASGVQR
jgi:hypothetical protein